MISIVGTRLAGAILLLGTLVALELAFPEHFPLIVSVGLIAALFLAWATFVFFGRRAIEDPSIISLRARTQDALSLALGQSMAAFMGVLVILRALDRIQPVDRGVFLVGLSFCLAMIAAPAINWLLIWRPWRAG